MDNIDTNMNMDVNSEEINNLGKEDALRMIRKYMAKILEDDKDGTFKDACNIMTNVIDNYESIDKEMVARLNDIFSNDMVRKEEYLNVLTAIKDGSTVVYFKSAQLFKVYKPSELENLLGGQLRTIYRQFKESYELVPNDSKQKIIIMGDSSLIDKLDRITSYITRFMKNEGMNDFKNDDVVCYKNDDRLEIIINNYYVENSLERNEIVQKLLNFIVEQEKNDLIVGKIMPANLKYSEFKGVEMISMPTEKELISSKYIEPIMAMVGNIHKCTGYGKLTVNVHIENMHVHNDNSTNITEVKSYENKNDFGKYIRDTKPDWYTPGVQFDKNILLKKYEEVYGNITKQMFHKTYVGKIFDKTTRVVISGVRVTNVRLFNYDDILDLNGE